MSENNGEFLWTVNLDTSKIRLIYGALFLLYLSRYGIAIDNNTAVVSDICETCKCNSQTKEMDCKNLSLMNVFEDKEWALVNSSSNASALINIVFDNNGIEKITDFPQMDTITLSLQNNKIKTIEKQAFFNLTKLEKLDLSYNRLTIDAIQKNVFEGPYDASEYEPMKSLKWLSLANNEIHALKKDAFYHLENLEVLILAHNTIKVIEPNTASLISGLTRLKVLDLSFTELRDLPEHIFHAPHNLESLDLTGNLFTKLPFALHFASNLVHLTLDDNPFEYIGGDNNSFPVLPKLETLNLSNSHTLKIIDNGAFQNLSALQHFICQNNHHLRSIHPHSFANPKSELHVQWPPMRSLVLSSNNLTSISEELFADQWVHFEEIDIRQNKWECSCENQWMVDTLIPIIKTKSKENPSMFEDLRCDTPIEMKSKQLIEISAKNEHMRCEDYYGRRPERDGSILVGIFIGLMIGIPVTLALLFIYRRGCFGILGYRPSPADYGRT